MTIGEKIKTLRQKKRLTQKQLGDLCGMADSAIRRYENGRAKPKIETLQKIADALDIKISELISLNDAIGSVLETTEENRIIHTYSAIEVAIKDNLNKMNNLAKKKVYDYTEDLIQNPQNWKNTKE
ncbi:hypothetical protein JCM31739_05280 [Faecalimonas canis]